MQLNLPIIHLVENSESILIAGAGGGFDIYAGLPIYFTLREMGKTVHLANYSFADEMMIRIFTEVIEEIPDILLACKGEMRRDIIGYPAAFLADWLAKHTDEEPIIWLFLNLGVQQLVSAYQHLQERLQFDTLILVDGGVDSLSRGDERGPGSMLEDSISLVAAESLDVPTKILACVGFGTEAEDNVDHYAALENIAGITSDGGFYGTCSLTKDMPVFQKYEAICRYAWEGRSRAKSHISTRVIPAVHGEFGDFHMYPDEHEKRHIRLFISPLMGIYWFFNADIVAKRNLLADSIRQTTTKSETRRVLLSQVTQIKPKRSHRQIPY